MCGRFTLASPAETIASTFDLEEVPELSPRYNIAPTEPVAAIRLRPPGPDAKDPGSHRVLEMRRWGLVPHWARSISGPPLFNARAETLAERPAFRDAFRRHRCLVPADGFYEWKAASGRRQPYHQRREDGAPFAMAGLFASWRPDDGDAPVESCTVVTTEANGLLAPVHDRMPVILAPEAWRLWLDPEIEAGTLDGLLQPAPPEGWLSYPVDPRVNRARHDDPRNVEPLFDALPFDGLDGADGAP